MDLGAFCFDYRSTILRAKRILNSWRASPLTSKLKVKWIGTEILERVKSRVASIPDSPEPPLPYEFVIYPTSIRGKTIILAKAVGAATEEKIIRGKT